MPLILWIGTLLGTLFTALFSFFLQFATKKLLVIAAVVSAIGFLTFGFFVAITSLIQSLAGAMPAPIVQGVSLFLPANTTLCMTSIFTAHIIRWIYEWNVKVIQMRLS